MYLRDQANRVSLADIDINNIGLDNLQTYMNVEGKNETKVLMKFLGSSDLVVLKHIIGLIGRENLPRLDLAVVFNFRIARYLVEELKIPPVDINVWDEPVGDAFFFGILETYDYFVGLGYSIYRSMFVRRYLSVADDQFGATIRTQRNFFRKIRTFRIDISAISSENPYHAPYIMLTSAWNEWTVLDVMLVYVSPVVEDSDEADPEFIKLIREQKVGHMLSVKRQSIQHLLGLDYFPMKKWLQKINRITN